MFVAVVCKNCVLVGDDSELVQVGYDIGIATVHFVCRKRFYWGVYRSVGIPKNTAKDGNHNEKIQQHGVAARQRSARLQSSVANQESPGQLITKPEYIW